MYGAQCSLARDEAQTAAAAEQHTEPPNETLRRDNKKCDNQLLKLTEVDEKIDSPVAK